MVINGIDNVSGVSSVFPSPVKGGAKAEPPAAGFAKSIGEMVNNVNNLQLDADKAIQQLATGESKGLHEVMIAVEKAGISFQFMTQVRNKAVEAYQEIMRMQV